MKYLVVLVVVMALVWVLRSGRRRDAGAAASRAAGPRARPQTMVDCAHCGLHLPRDEAITGDDGRHYCSAAHRLAGPR
ncbi:MAG: hypothetical protein KatS3mg122_0301 [Caldimonas sp.]|uniref:PP0621 family protein n=1 Tax=Caldimonas taiwanensis TaxID=307483 RepID=UPI0007815DD2|nr:PP0621 family protein [Caldimonas taiwanensis]GIX23070.1 MAG: hypothetical protein KatS3mg122_0301 [Caldimonas sp.]